MSIVIDLADPETDIEEVKELIFHIYDDDIRQTMYRVQAYIFAQVDTIEDDVLDTIIQYDEVEGPVDGEFNNAEELRQEIEQTRDRMQQRKSANRQLDTMMTHLVDVLEYTYTGDGYKPALEAQKNAISNNRDLTINIETQFLDN